MIVYSNKQFTKCADFPNEDFVGNADWVLDDNKQAELENKIISLYPNYDFVLDGDGQLVDVTPTEPDITIIKEAKISEMDAICTQTIYDGIDIELSTGVEHFTLDEHDQANLLGLGLELGQGAEMVTWHNDDKNESCKFYSAADATKIISSLTVWKSYHITFYRDLRIYINSLTTKAEIDAVTYGMELPEEFKSDVLKYYESIIKG